jgi:hypothetical protein
VLSSSRNERGKRKRGMERRAAHQPCSPRHGARLAKRGPPAACASSMKDARLSALHCGSRAEFSAPLQLQAALCVGIRASRQRAPRSRLLVASGRCPGAARDHACEARAREAAPGRGLAPGPSAKGWRARCAAQEAASPAPTRADAGRARYRPFTDPLRLMTPLEAPLSERGWVGR